MASMAAKEVYPILDNEKIKMPWDKLKEEILSSLNKIETVVVSIIKDANYSNKELSDMTLNLSAKLMASSSFYEFISFVDTISLQDKSLVNKALNLTLIERYDSLNSIISGVFSEDNDDVVKTMKLFKEKVPTLKSSWYDLSEFENYIKSTM